MKRKFIDLLKSTYKDVGVSSKTFDRAADYYEQNGQLPEELSDEDLQKIVDSAKPILIMAKAESDSKLEDFKKKNNPTEKPKEEKTDLPKEEDKPKDEMPAWFKTYAEANDKKIDALIGDKVNTTRKSDYEKTALTGVADADKQRALNQFDRLTKDMTDEEFEAWKQEETTYHQARVQQQAVDNLGGLEPNQSTGNKAKPSQTEIQELAKKLVS